MYYCKGRFSRLVELNSKNDTSLFFLLKRNIDEYRSFVSDQNLPTTYTGFLDTLKIWFSSGRLYQFLVYSVVSNELIGTIFFYHYNLQKRSVKISVFFEKRFRKQLGVAESMAMAIVFARQVIKVESISFSVYSENLNMLNLVKKLACDSQTITSSCVNKQREVWVYEMRSGVLDDISNKFKKLYR